MREAIDRVIEDSTSIVIAHRLSTILHADKIVVLSDGRIESVGRHENLLESARPTRVSTACSSNATSNPTCRCRCVAKFRN